MTRYILCAAMVMNALIHPLKALTPQERRQYLEKLLQTLPDVPSFRQWLEKTGEIPPDFDAFPKINGLPDPLKFLDGRPVRTPAEWKARRVQIRQLLEKYVIGSFPPKTKLDRAVVLDETPGKGYRIRNVRLEFGPQSKGTMRVQVMIPDGKGPFPVLISPNLTGWGPLLLRRGYISCGYAANDGMDDAAALAPLYPDYDFAALPRRAWAAGMVLELVKAGYAVLAFDQSGFGSRMSETAPFYDRYPHWSHMGRMVEDTRAAIDALEKDSMVDPQRIYLFGFSMGGMAGLYAAALDSRVKGVVSICGFTPMRTDTADRGTGGVARYSHERGLIPRLGFFVGHEDRIPYDFHELLGTIAPRPALVIQPQLDRDATPADVHTAVEQARKVYALYGTPDKLALHEPWDYNRLPDATQDWIIQWMSRNLQADGGR